MALEMVQVTEAAELSCAKWMGTGDKVSADRVAVESMRERLNVLDFNGTVLDQPRHNDLIARIRKLGARIRLISDGDVSAAIATARPDTGVDVLMGLGGAPEGVLAAAALRCLGGEIQGKLRFQDNEERERATRMGVKDLDKTYKSDELAMGHDVMFCATGVTDGELLDGVRFSREGSNTHSVVMRLQTRTIRFIETFHHYHSGPE